MSTISNNLIKSYQQVPSQVAVYLQHAGRDDVPITYSELFLSSVRYTRVLETHGIQPGEVVVLILKHGEDLIFSFFGTVLLGAIPSIMPFLTEKLSPERYRSDFAALIEVTKPAAIVTYAEFEGGSPCCH